LFRRVVAWRWTPCVAPVMGSVSIALLTLALVPEEIGSGSAATGPLALRPKHDVTSDAASNDMAEDGVAAPGAPGAARLPSRAHLGADGVQGFFHKPQDLPVAPVDPTPAPPPPEPPPPAATATVYTLPEATVVPPPAPVEPGTLPPPEVPLQPLGPGPTTPPVQ